MASTHMCMELHQVGQSEMTSPTTETDPEGITREVLAGVYINGDQTLYTHIISIVKQMHYALKYFSHGRQVLEQLCSKHIKHIDKL